jgi:hypothetical protein
MNDITAVEMTKGRELCASCAISDGACREFALQAIADRSD